MDIDPAILPTLDKDMLTFYDVTFFMQREECLFQPDGCEQVYRFLCALLRDPNFTMPEPTSTAVTNILYDIHGGLIWDEQFASLWPSTPPTKSHVTSSTARQQLSVTKVTVNLSLRPGVGTLQLSQKPLPH